VKYIIIMFFIIKKIMYECTYIKHISYYTILSIFMDKLKSNYKRLLIII